MILQAGADFPKYRGIQSQCDGNTTTRVFGSKSRRSCKDLLSNRNARLVKLRSIFLKTILGPFGFWCFFSLVFQSYLLRFRVLGYGFFGSSHDTSSRGRCLEAWGSVFRLENMGPSKKPDLLGIHPLLARSWAAESADFREVFTPRLLKRKEAWWQNLRVEVLAILRLWFF